MSLCTVGAFCYPENVEIGHVLFARPLCPCRGLDISLVEVIRLSRKSERCGRSIGIFFVTFKLSNQRYYLGWNFNVTNAYVNEVRRFSLRVADLSSPVH